MNKKALHRILILLLPALLGTLLAACGHLPTDAGQARTQTSYSVDAVFESYYLQMGGFERLGEAISGVSNDNGRQCQYTTNGVMCFDPALSEDERYSFTFVRAESSFSTPYDRILDRMGGRRVFGEPQGEPVIAEDGQMEQAYTNIVIYSPPDNPNAVQFRPLGRSLGMPARQPGPKKYDRRQNVIFYPVDGDLGFHVPVVFDEFIAQHGGTEKSGKPISEPMAIEVKGEKVARQCFENYCLDYYNNAPQGVQVRLAPLGMQHRANISSATHTALPQPEALSMLISEDKTQLNSLDSQTFYLLVYKDHTKEPQAGITARIELMLPNGNSYLYQTPPTGVNGWTSLTIPPLPNLQHGMMVAYQVCLEQPVEPQPCTSETYLVWNY